MKKAIEFTNDRPVVPIIPTHREGQRRIHEPFCEFDMTTCDRQVRDHFAQRYLTGDCKLNQRAPAGEMTYHYSKDNCTHSYITKQETNRSTISKGCGSSDEKAGTDDTTNTGRILSEGRMGWGRGEGIYLIMATCRFLSCLRSFCG